MTENKTFAYLLKRYLEHTSTPEELQAFGQLIDTLDDETLANLIQENWLDHKPSVSLEKEESEALLSRILNSHKEDAGRPLKAGLLKRLKPFLKYAAILVGIAILSIPIWKMQLLSPTDTEKVKASGTELLASSDIAPGNAGAVLTLASGEQVHLDSTTSGLVARTTDAIINLTPGGIVYNGVKNKQAAVGKYNMLTTPVGKTYNIQLPDGTSVWLNASSSIKYPVSFDADKREVLITGEAYFEVAKLENKKGNGRVPFIVNIRSAQHPDKISKVEVLGTHFNINAYADDGKIRTTLLEGKVNVYGVDAKRATTITPGNQAEMDAARSSAVSVKPVDLSRAVAWKNGYFDFDQASLPEVMSQIGRWYNVKVIYPSEVPQRIFWGKMQRSLYLSQVLSLLERVDIHFKIDNDKLIVMP